jgi:hypothetical protein
MSQIVTRNAHARNHANSELPKITPRNGRAASQNRGRGSAPIPFSSRLPTSSAGPDNVPDTLEREEPSVPPLIPVPNPHPSANSPANSQQQRNEDRPDVPGSVEAAGTADGAPDPPDDGSNSGPGGDDGDDGDDRDEESMYGTYGPYMDDPFWGNRTPDNVTARDLLRILGPMLAERRAVSTPAPIAPSSSRRLKVNPPEEFDGHSPKKLKSFLVSCNNAFRGDPDTFRHHDKRVSYALSYLRGSAQRHFDTQLEDEEEVSFIPPEWLNDWARFVEELRDMFGDPNAEATAEAELDVLRMRTNQKFVDFLVDFNTLSSQVNWGDRALRHRLKHALPDRIKDSLALVQEPVVFGDWKRLVQNIDQRYWERQAEIRRETRPNHTNNTNRGNPSTNVRNTTQGTSTAPATTTPRETKTASPVAAHLTPQGGLTQTERERRIAQGLCLYCGGTGHKASECSKARKAREKTGRVAKTTEDANTLPTTSTTPDAPKITVISEN